MNAAANKCKCGCGETSIWPSDYIPGHDLIHRNRLIDMAGGVDKLTELLKLVEAYIAGDATEADLTRGIRHIRAEQS